MMEKFTITKNDKREIVKIIKNGLYSYAWIENNELVMNRMNFQEEETLLIPTKEELENLFPTVKINTKIQKNYDSCKCKYIDEECTIIQ